MIFIYMLEFLATYLYVLLMVDLMLITLEEVNAAWVQQLKDGTKGAYPYVVDASADDFRGVVVLSSIPIDSYDKILFNDATPPVLRLNFSKPQLTLFAVHSLAPISES